MPRTFTSSLQQNCTRLLRCPQEWIQTRRLFRESTLTKRRLAHERRAVDSENTLTFTDATSTDNGLRETGKGQYALKGISFAGAGIFFWWELGCVLWLLEHVDVDACPFFGASGGALAATLAACKVDPFKAFYAALRISEESNLFERPLGLAGIWGSLIESWLDELLPDNAAEICRGRVSLVVTTLPTMNLQAISDFESREELINANMASAHIPFFLDGKLSKRFGDWDCIDGSLHDFFSGDNSDLLTCDGNTLLFDYFDDENLDRKRFDFLALKKPTEVLNMMTLGYEFTERLSREESFQKVLVGKSAKPSSFNSL